MEVMHHLSKGHALHYKAILVAYLYIYIYMCIYACIPPTSIPENALDMKNQRLGLTPVPELYTCWADCVSWQSNGSEVEESKGHFRRGWIL